MKDHEIAKVINDVTHVARVYGQTQQIRERIRTMLEPVLKGAQPRREPLSFEERRALWKALSDMDEGIDFNSIVTGVEKAYGIGE